VIRLSISSQKGGVGKTTLSINLAYSLARAGLRTVLVDADPQGSVGLSLTRQSRQLLGLYDYLANPAAKFESFILPTRLDTLSLVSAGIASNYADNKGSTGAYLSRIQDFFHKLAAYQFDVCIIDTAAGLFGITNDIIASSDAILIPQQAEPLGIRSLPKLLEGLNHLRIFNPRLQVLGVCLTMLQNDLRESKEAAAALRQLLPDEMLFQTDIPRDDIFISASAKGLPVGVIENGKKSAAIFDSLRSEITRKMANSKQSNLAPARSWI